MTKRSLALSDFAPRKVRDIAPLLLNDEKRLRVT